ncbi:MAG: hypothetical protein M5U01_43480 [Ardenticatenaceae bacterium]|nr:hypothetical protein [Ardenticatenaceae bacterium]
MSDREMDAATHTGSTFSDVALYIHCYLEELMTIQRAAIVLGAERDPRRVLHLVAEQAVGLVNASYALRGLLIPEGGRSPPSSGMSCAPH